MTDPGRLDSTATQSVLIQAEILFLLEEMLVRMLFSLPQINS